MKGHMRAGELWASIIEPKRLNPTLLAVVNPLSESPETTMHRAGAGKRECAARTGLLEGNKFSDA
jgi:hypothetical protein